MDLRLVHPCLFEGMSLRNVEVARTCAFLFPQWHVILETICVVLVLLEPEMHVLGMRTVQVLKCDIATHVEAMLRAEELE